MMNLVRGIEWSRVLVIFLLSLTGAPESAAEATISVQGVEQLVDALVRKRCAEDDRYRTIAGVTCDDLGDPSGGTVGEADPDAVLRQLGAITRETVLGLSHQARQDDELCARGAIIEAATGGLAVGPLTGEEMLEHFTIVALQDVLDPLTMGSGLVLSIPGVTQVQYFYKGLSNGPVVRTFKIRGQLQGDVDNAKLYLEMDGDVEGGDKNLPIEYMVNLKTSRSSFPAWSPFLDQPGDLQVAFKRDDLVLISPIAVFTEKGQQRNGVKAWHDYEYIWFAEKIGAQPTDILVQEGSDPVVGKYPYAGDWVGIGWSAETRFKQTGRQFVSQFSRQAAAAMSVESAAEGIIMALNVKHQTIFYLHIDNEGKVSGRGVITYMLDPNLCGLASLTRQVNEHINMMKYLPMIYAAAGAAAKLVGIRWQKTWTHVPSKITNKVDEYIRKVSNKRIMPEIGARRVDSIRATALKRAEELGLPREGINKLKQGNISYVDTDIPRYPVKRLKAVSGEQRFKKLGFCEPVPEPRYKTNWWAFKGKPRMGGWDPPKGGRTPFERGFDAERIIIENLVKDLTAKGIPKNTSGIVRIYSRYPVCPSCMGVIEQFFADYTKLTILVTSGL
jgi:hypothetical protein